ncbi:MAG TPA: hypothetical protein VGH74_07545 [Planctomycetaceae bacterium]|jgi:hypothetical protein
MSCCDRLIEAAGTTTPCECPVAGYCARHKCDKGSHFHRLCKTSIQYFAQYENFATGLSDFPGPGQVVIPAGPRRFSLGLGDVVAWCVRFVTFGQVALCPGCQGRKARLNRVRLWPIPWPWSNR